MNQYEKHRSPFYPGQPVPPELFVGRAAEIERLFRAYRQVAAGKPQAAFIQGEYGIGKSSLANYLHAALDNASPPLLGLHVFLGGVRSIEDLAVKTVETALETRAGRPSARDKIRNTLAKYVGEQGLLGITVRFDELKKDAPDLSRGYLPFLSHLFERVSEESYGGLLLILDEINGITDNPEFAHFIKTLVDANAVRPQPVPLYLILCGVETRRRSMIAAHEPIERIFDVICVAPMSPDESTTFFEKAFASVEIAIEPEAMNLLVFYSGGLPKLMHLLGDHAYFAAKDEKLTMGDALDALREAAYDVGRRYFDRQVLGALQSNDYRGILKKLGGMELSLSFEKQDLEQRLTTREKGKLNNFLQKMKKLNVIRGVVRGKYEFNDWLTRIYIMMKARPPSPPSQ